MGRLENKVVLITAAADGIGLATAHRLSGEGARVIISDIDEMAVLSVADREGWLGLVHDAGSEEDWRTVIEVIKAQYGCLDILVNNAGIGEAPGDIESQSLQAFQNVIRVQFQ